VQCEYPFVGHAVFFGFFFSNNVCRKSAQTVFVVNNQFVFVGSSQQVFVKALVQIGKLAVYGF
jgi:hypothetical protein